MKSTVEKSTYEPPVLTVLGSVYDLTEGCPAGPEPDGFNPNHNTISPVSPCVP